MVARVVAARTSVRARAMAPPAPGFRPVRHMNPPNMSGKGNVDARTPLVPTQPSPPFRSIGPFSGRFSHLVPNDQYGALHVVQLPPRWNEAVHMNS